MKPFSVTLLITCLLLCGCASDVANRYYSSIKYPSKAPELVEILDSKPDRKFEVIADFQSRGESGKSLQKKAAELGADAVIVTTLGGYYSRNEEWASEDRHKDSFSRIIGSAIIYTD